MKKTEKRLLKELANLHKTKDVSNLFGIGFKHFGFTESIKTYSRRELEFCDIHSLIESYYLCNTERYFTLLIELQNQFNYENKQNS